MPPTRSLPLRAAPVAAAVLALTVVAGCTGGDDDGPTDADPAARLAVARTVLDEAASLQIRLVTEQLPDGTLGLVEADGVGNHDPAFEGTVTVVAGGMGQVDADLVSVEGEVVAKIGFIPDFTPVDPADFGAPDPAELVAAEDGVSSWLTETVDPVAGEQSRDGEEVLTTVDGTLPGAVVQALIPSADDAADFDVSYRLTEADELRDAAITGPFYPGGDDVTYDLEVTASDDPVDIVLP